MYILQAKSCIFGMFGKLWDIYIYIYITGKFMYIQHVRTIVGYIYICINIADQFMFILHVLGVVGFIYGRRIHVYLACLGFC